MASLTCGGSDLLAISDLLQGGYDAEEERYEASKASDKFFTPGDIGPPRSEEITQSKQDPQVADPKAIWEEEEALKERDVLFDPDDPRPQPEYDVVYKQSVMAEDTFLGTTGKTPGSQDCTHVVVKVVFPGCRMSDLEVDATKNSIMAASPNLRLATYLPLPVDDAKGVAKWDAASETLSVTLPIIADEL